MSLQGLKLDHDMIREDGYRDGFREGHKDGYKRGHSIALKEYHTKLLIELENFQRAMVAAHNAQRDMT